MAAPSSNLERVINFLLDVCQRCEAKRSATEKACHDCKLLLRPWPTKVDPKKKHAMKQQERGVVEGMSKDKVKEKELSHQEAEELALLDTMLSKAHKARETQAKVEAKLAKKNKSLPPIKLSPENKVLPDHQENISKTDKPPNGAGHVATFSKSTLNRLLGDSKTQRTGASTDKRTSSASCKKPTSATRPRASQHKTTIIKQHYKTSASEIGRYQSKSQSGSRGRGQRLPSLTSSSSEPGSVVAAVRSRSLDRAGRTGTEGPQRSRSGSLTDDSGCVIQSNNAAGKESKNNDVCDLVDRTKHLQVEECRSSVLPKQHKSAVSGCHGDCAKQCDVDEQEEEPFTLRKDGSKLTFPVRFKKMYSANRKLRQKADAQREKQSKMDLSNHFIDRLESHFQAGSISLSEEELVRRVDGLKSEYEHLVKITNMVLVDMKKLSENSPWQDLYRTKFMIGKIKERYYEMQEEIQHLIIGEQQLFNGCPCSDCKYVQHHMEQLYDKHTRHLLIPPDKSDECTMLQNGTCTTTTTKENTEYLLYTNVKQLKEIITLQHDIVILQLQVQLEKLVAEEVLPILHELNPHDTSYITLYRSAYSMLHNGGRLFPAMIKDNIDDDNED